MNIKKKLLTIAIGTFMVFSLSLTTSESLAYWTAGFAADNAVTSPTVTSGTWDYIGPWGSGISYVTGDKVTHNGTTYQAKKDNPTKEPGVDGGL